MLAVLEAMDGDFERARDRWRRTKRRLEDVGLGVSAAFLEMYPVFIELMAGTPEKAEGEMAAAYAVVEQTGDQSRLATMAALVARIQYAQGRFDEAERHTVISEEAASQDDVASQIMWRGARARVLARAGNAHAVELAGSAVALAEQTDLLMLHGDALRDRAEVMALVARPTEAMRDLERAIALYERKGMRASADAARRFLASLAPLAEASSVS
jgi:hypothetical protein